MARVALVTGGMGGLGEAICIKLAALGYKVVTTYSPGSKKAEGWLAAMREQGHDFKAYECDVADYDSAQACVAKVVQDVGPVDVLVNNAGITRDMTFKKMDKVNWDAVMKTNLDSVFNMTKPVTKRLNDEVVTTFKVKNPSATSSIAGLKISEFWYDKDGNPVSGDEFRYRKPLMPGEVIDVELRSPVNPKMARSQYKFEQSNGGVKPQVVAKF